MSGNHGAGPVWVFEGNDAESAEIVLRLSEEALRRTYLGLTVGRHPMLCHLTLDEASLSRRHARFCLTAGGLCVEDLSSTNGTAVDGEALAPFALVPVKPGSTIELGALHVRLIGRE